MASEELNARHELTRVIQRVRNRWRLRVVLRGVALLLVAGSLAIALSAFGLDYFRYSPWALAVFRIAAYATVAALLLRLVALPAARRLSDERIALYIEEHDPSLQATLLSAVEVSAPRASEAGAPSPALAHRLVETAIRKCNEVDYGRRVERRGLQRFSAILAGVAGAAMVAALLSPAFLRRAAPYLLTPWNVRAASPYSIDVVPGHTSLARGADQEVAAMPQGFTAEGAELASRRAVPAGAGSPTPPSASEWKRVPMTADPEGKGFRLVLLDLGEATDYFVEAAGVRSAIFRLDVTDRPYVKRIDLEYRFPAHTGLGPKKVEDGGDVTALAGTAVVLRIEPTVSVAAGQLVVEGSAPVALTGEPDGTLVGELTVSRSGFYRIDLPGSDGALRKASPDYAIEVLLDQPPTVAVSKPGRDTRVTSIEEVFTEARAEDDFGISRLELVYSANGGAEKVVELVPPGRARKAASAGHTFFLEEMGLEVGDSVSYFVRASDNAARAQVATSDIYFMEVRPFGREYRKAEEGGGGAGGQDGGALSQEQRQIIAATFKVVRDRARTADKEFAEDVATLARAEAHLGSQVRTLLDRMTGRGVVEPGSDLQKTADALRSSLPEMEAARAELAKTRAREALPPEQRALRHLLHAESVFREMQVSMGQGEASSDGSKSSAEDLADLFELEMDKLRNQYETLRRSQQQQRDNAVDEAKERLAELARRQQQENERMKRLADQTPGTSGGDPRADLAKETEELARKLERLSRENGGASLQDTARRLRDAADAMKRASAGGKDQGLAEGLSALERLQEASRRLGEGRSQGLEQEIQEARRRADRLAETEREIGAEVERLAGEPGAGSDASRLTRLRDRKDLLGAELADLEAQLDRLARESRRDRKETSRRLQEAANGVREDKLKEKIKFSKGLGRGLSPEYARQLEGDIAQGLDAIGRKVREAGSALGGSENDKRAAALEKTRDLVRNLESMESRLKDRAERGSGKDGSGKSEGSGKEGSGKPSGSGKEGSGKPSGSGQAEGSGKADGSGKDGSGSAGGPASPAGGTGAPRGGALTAEEARQIRRERQERFREAQELGQGFPGGRPDLARVLEGIGAWNSKKTDDPRALARITAEVIENLKMFEYTLRRETEGMNPERLALSEGDDVPQGFRPLVEEYYKSLARKPRK